MNTNHPSYSETLRMATHNADGKELFVCGACKCRRTADEFDVDRHGHRRKGCVPCQRKREANRCPHGKLLKRDCQTCCPGKFCEHGKCIDRHTCVVCDPVGNERRKHIRNAREFATQPGGWPFEHIIVGPQGRYDTVVGKWKKTFETLLSDGDIDEGLHGRILCNLKPASPINVAAS